MHVAESILFVVEIIEMKVDDVSVLFLRKSYDEFANYFMKI